MLKCANLWAVWAPHELSGWPLIEFCGCVSPGPTVRASPETAGRASPGPTVRASPETAGRASPGTAGRASPGTAGRASPGTAGWASPGSTGRAPCGCSRWVHCADWLCTSAKSPHPDPPPKKKMSQVLKRTGATE
jgi:hypothetical protein